MEYAAGYDGRAPFRSIILKGAFSRLDERHVLQLHYDVVDFPSRRHYNIPQVE